MHSILFAAWQAGLLVHCKMNAARQQRDDRFLLYESVCTGCIHVTNPHISAKTPPNHVHPILARRFKKRG